MAPRRRGRVEISMQALRFDHQAALDISRDLVIWRIDENMMMDTITWWAESEHFDLIDQGEIPPEYTVTATANDDGVVAVNFKRE